MKAIITFSGNGSRMAQVQEENNDLLKINTKEYLLKKSNIQNKLNYINKVKTGNVELF